MIRGSTLSAILHISLLALLIFGVPHIVLLVDEKPRDEPSHIEVATVTPEQADAIERAAASAANQASQAGKGGLTTDAVNSEPPADRRTILQSASSSSVLAKPEDKADEQDASQAQRTPRANPIEAVQPVPGSPGVTLRADAQSSPARRAEPQQISSPETVPQQTPELPRATHSTAERAPSITSAPTPLLPPRSNATQQSDAPTEAQQDNDAQVPQQSDTRVERPAQVAAIAEPTQASSTETPPSAALLLAQGDAVVQALRPLVAALPRLDETIGEILAAQSRDAAAIAAAANGTPASQQTIRRLESAAEQGYAHAQFTLAEVYLTGDGRPRDVERGRAYLQRAAVNGNIPAQLLLAALAVEGSVVPRDMAEAHAWLSVAGEQGNRQAREILPQIEQQMNAREELRARQRRAQLRQVFILSNPRSDRVIKQSPKEEQLRVATTLGDTESVYIALGAGANADAADEDGRTPAIEAAWRGYGKIVGALLDQGVNVSKADSSGKTALIWAAINGHRAVAEQLINADLPINTQDAEGLTALMRAAWNGHADVVRLLLQKKADTRLRDRSGKTALDYANQSRSPETIRLMQEASRS